jgi:hypothetical protein
MATGDAIKRAAEVTKEKTKEVVHDTAKKVEDKTEKK